VKRILLIGAGHGHLVVLRSLAEKPLYGARITLVTPYAKQVYSGMLPGLLAGHYRRADTQIDVAALAERAFVEFEQGEVERLDAEGRLVILKDGRSVGYDTVSLNAGSMIDTSLSGARHHALAVKPFDRFVSQLGSAERVAVVGAGAAGAEIAMALRHRGAQVTLYSGAPLQPPALAERTIPQLRRRKVDYRPGMPVTGIAQGPVVIAGAARQAFDLVILATGAAPLPWLKRAGLATDERGFALVHRTLQSVSHPEVFVLGDCATLRDSPHPKSGVYAVRHGELLAANLRRLFSAEPLQPYVPQKRALLLLTCGARYAIAQRGGWSAQGRALWWLKDGIDRRWVASFR
jgi:pyridine nucleotide-disulfide oxidoreductase family protein